MVRSIFIMLVISGALSACAPPGYEYETGTLTIVPTPATRLARERAQALAEQQRQQQWATDHPREAAASQAASADASARQAAREQVLQRLSILCPFVFRIATEARAFKASGWIEPRTADYLVTEYAYGANGQVFRGSSNAEALVRDAVANEYAGHGLDTQEQLGQCLGGGKEFSAH